MESFAFWYKLKSEKGSSAPDPDALKPENKVVATMNFNLWTQCGWNINPFFDIGFKIEKLNYAEELYFFLPFNIENKCKTKYLEDLGCKFSRTELVDAVFNKSFATTIAANKKTIAVTSATSTSDVKSDSFYIYQLDVEHDIELESFADGTIVKIATDNILNSVSKEDDEPIFYLRFRVKEHPLDFLIHQYVAPHRVFQSLFNTTYMIDFRFHNVRSLHKTLLERFNKSNTKVVSIKALHFLLMTKAYIDVTITNNDFKGIRKIEKGVWSSYVSNNDTGELDTEDLLAYHIAQKAKLEKDDSTSKEEIEYITSSELFAKFRAERSILPGYIIFTIILGAVGSFISSIFIQPVFAPWIKSLIAFLFVQQ